MMGVYIRGMEMPKRCFECIFLTTVPNFFCLAGKKDLCAEHGINISRPDWCPLVEIPTPHGRLIDADKLKGRLVLDNDSSELQKISADIHRWIDSQETVIEEREE